MSEHSLLDAHGRGLESKKIRNLYKWQMERFAIAIAVRDATTSNKQHPSIYQSQSAVAFDWHQGIPLV